MSNSKQNEPKTVALKQEEGIIIPASVTYNKVCDSHLIIFFSLCIYICMYMCYNIITFHQEYIQHTLGFAQMRISALQ